MKLAAVKPRAAPSKRSMAQDQKSYSIGLAPFWIAPHSVHPYMPTRPPSSQARAVLLRRGLP